MDKKTLLSILHQEVVPSLGVTEPGAVALCCAAASDNNSIMVSSIELTVSPNIYKNCMSVGIPGFSKKGIIAAAALGAAGGNYKLGLEALGGITDKAVSICEKLIQDNKVKVAISDNGELLYIEAKCYGANGEGRCIISKSHSHICLIEKNGNLIYQASESEENTTEDDSHNLCESSLKEIKETVETMTEEELSFLAEGAEKNISAARWGLEHKPGMGVGAHMLSLREQGLLANSLSTELQIYTCAASDVRVSGSFVPIMTCAGSGNHGITALVPVAMAGKWLHADALTSMRALAISCLITVYIKNYSGKLSGMCGCGVASATGVATALTYLMGGTLAQMENSIKNMAGDITGMICDGAKDGCSLKLSTAVSSAVKAAVFAARDIVIPDDNGIIGRTAEQTMRNMGTISAVGMAPTDKVILDVMQDL